MGGQFPGGPGMGGISGSAMNAVGGGGVGGRTSAGGGGGQAVAPAGGDAGATRYNIMPAGGQKEIDVWLGLFVMPFSILCEANMSKLMAFVCQGVGLTRGGGAGVRGQWWRWRRAGRSTGGW